MKKIFVIALMLYALLPTGSTYADDSEFNKLADQAYEMTKSWITKVGVQVELPSTLKTEVYWYYEANAATGRLTYDYGYQVYTLVPEKGYLAYRSRDKRSLIGPGRAIPATQEISGRYGLGNKPYLDFAPQTLLVRWKADTDFSEALNVLKAIELYPPNLHQVVWNQTLKEFVWVDFHNPFGELEYAQKLKESHLVESVLVDLIPLKVHPGMTPKFDLVFSRN